MKQFTALLLAISVGLGGLPLHAQKSIPPKEQSPLEAHNERIQNALKVLDTIDNEGRGEDNPLDPFKLLNQWVIEISRIQRIRSSRLSFQIVDEDKDTVLDQEQYDEKTGAKVKDVIVDSDKTRFEILFRGEPVNIFTRNIKAFVQFGSDLVLLDQKKDRSYRLLLVDLASFKNSIGRSQIPVFEIPKQFEGPIDELEVFNGKLIINGEEYTKEHFDVFKRSMHTALNVSAAMSRPSGLESAEVLLNEFDSTFNKAIENVSDGVFDSIVNVEKMHSSAEAFRAKIKNFLEKRAQTETAQQRQNIVDFLKEEAADDPNAETPSLETLQAYEHLIAGQGMLEEIQSSSIESQRSRKKLVRATRMLWSYLSSPRKNAAKELLTSIGYVAKGLTQGSGRKLVNGIDDFSKNPWFKRGGTALLLGAVAGTVAPEMTSQFLYGSLSMFSAAGSVAADIIKGLAYVAGQAAAGTAEGFYKYSSLLDTYLYGGRGSKTLVGMTAITTIVYSMTAIPHLLINGARIAKAAKKANWSRLKDKEGSTWAAFRHFYTNLERTSRADLNAALATGKSNPEHVAKRYTVSEMEEINRKRQEVLEEFSNKTILRVVKRVSTWPIVGRIVNKKENQIDSIYGAMLHTLFGISSWTHTAQGTVSFWNRYFGFRSFVWYPSLYPIFLATPNFFKSIVTQDKTNVSPSVYNGGLGGPLGRIRRAVAGRQLKKDQDYGELLRSTLSDQTTLEALKAWENSVLGIEQIVQNESTRRALSALMRYTKSQSETNLTENREALSSLVNSKTDGLNADQKTFYRLYQHRVQIYVMEKLMTQWLEANQVSSEAQVEMSMTQKKLLSLEAIKEFEYTKEDILHLIDEAEAQPMLFEEIKAISDGTDSAWERYRINFLGYAAEKLNPENNAQAARIKTVETQRKNPRAMARGVRSMIASNLVDKPMELLLIFITLAGMEGDLIQPIQDEMFGANSFFFLSRYIFLRGFLYSVFSGVMSHVWSKLQYDDLNEGQFDKPLTEEQKNMTYLQFFRSQYKEHNNSYGATWWKNQKHMVKLMWDNMRASLTTTMILGFGTLGRVDLDMYINKYSIYYGTPFEGINNMSEQAFELSTPYFARNFTQKELEHPKVQETLSTITSKQRLKFNLFFRLYENILYNFIGNLTGMKTALLGSRSFSRAITGGHTFTHLVTDGVLRPLGNVLHAVPGADKVVNVCIAALETNFTAERKGEN